MLSRVALALTALAPALLLAGCGSSTDNATDTSTTAATGAPATSAPAGKATCSYPSDGQGSAGIKVTTPPATPAVSGDVKATMKTSIGAIGLTLDAKSAPCTVNSFVSLAKQGFFDKTSCHRLTTAGIYVLQCGDPSGTGSGGPGYSFADELAGTTPFAENKAAEKQYEQATGQKQEVKTYPTGTLAMANAGANTNGSQFFLVYGDSPLPPAYTVFGTIDAAGVKAITTAAKAGTDNGSDGHPKTAVDITSVTVD